MVSCSDHVIAEPKPKSLFRRQSWEFRHCDSPLSKEARERWLSQACDARIKGRSYRGVETWLRRNRGVPLKYGRVRHLGAIGGDDFRSLAVASAKRMVSVLDTWDGDEESLRSWTLDLTSEMRGSSEGRRAYLPS